MKQVVQHALQYANAEQDWWVSDMILHRIAGRLSISPGGDNRKKKFKIIPHDGHGGQQAGIRF